MRIGITERGDGGLNQSWRHKLHDVDGAIIITKAPYMLRDTFLPDNIVIHCTITGMGGTYYEPHAQSASVELDHYRWLVDQLGPERIVLRIDPIIPFQPLFNRALAVAPHARSRVRISFLDAYDHVKARVDRLVEDGIAPINHLRRYYNEQKHAPLHTRQSALAQLRYAVPSEYEIEICGEPGMPCTGCVSARDLRAMGIAENQATGTSRQRSSCACMAEKVELLEHRGQCPLKCVYCYWR